MHRRLLYHLNRLVDQGKIIVQFVQGKGEKCYVLNTNKHAEADTSFAHVIPLAQPLVRLEAYQQKKIIVAYDQRGWQSRINAVLLDSYNFSSTKLLHQHIIQINPVINDVIGIWGMEKFLLEEDLSTLSSFLRQIDIDTKDNNKYISLIIDLALAPELKYAEDFFETYARLNPDNIQITFVLDKKFMVHHQRFVKRIIRDFSEQSTKINFHNKEVHEAPVLKGRAGIYTITAGEWKTYLSEIRGKTIGLCFARCSIGVDIQRFFNEKRSEQDFRRFINKVARALLESNAIQRRTSSDSFKVINHLNKRPKEFFRFANNYIRLWNYDWQEEHFVDLLESTATALSEFNEVEETIFKSCGMPIRFCTRMASLFPKFEDNFFSERKYSKFTVTSPASLEKKETAQFLVTRAKIAKLLHYNDRVRFFRATPADTNEIFEEIKIILSNYNIPLITYDFAKRKEHVTLDQFMRND